MFTGRIALAASLALLLILSACSRERPTRSVVSVLPATPLSSALILDTSLPVDGTPTIADIYEFDFSSSPLFVEDRYDDISIGLVVDALAMPEYVDVFDENSTSWKPIGGALTASGAYFCFMFCLYQADRLASEVDGISPTDLLSAQGKFKVMTSINPWSPYLAARLIKFAPDYHFVKVMPTATFQYVSLAFQDGILYSCTDHNDHGPVRDSIVALDMTGQRLWATGFDTPNAYLSAFDGEAFWQLKGLDGPMARVDSVGQEIAVFEWPIGYAQSMAWADGSLWIVRHGSGSSAGIVEVDVDSSLVTGTAVAIPRFTIAREDVDAMTSDDHGLIIISGERILRYTFDGTFLSERMSPIPSIRAAAWDGESLWVLHHGPSVARTDATLLSRLTLD